MGAEHIRYRHLDYDHLAGLLNRYKDDPRPKFCVSETVFSMDGDQLDLPVFLQLAETYKAGVYLDEAHALGVLGHNGFGLSSMIDLMSYSVPIILMGTLGKALGCAGGYVATSHLIRSILINSCRGFIYSTAPSPIVVAAATCAWKLLPKLAQKRRDVLSKSAFLYKVLQEKGWNVRSSSTHILPIFLKTSEEVRFWKSKLLDKGIRVGGFWSPTVSQPRLRITVSSIHTQNDLNFLTDTLSSNF